MSKKRQDKRQAEVRRQAADPQVNATRLGYQDGRNLLKRISTTTRDRWVKIDGKWQKMDVRNAVHRVTADVHNGTIKARYPPVAGFSRTCGVRST